MGVNSDREELDQIDVNESWGGVGEDPDAVGGDRDGRSGRGRQSLAPFERNKPKEDVQQSAFSAYSTSTISGAVNNTKATLAKRHNTLTNNALAQVTNPKSNVKGPYSPNIDPSYTPNFLDKYAAENFEHVQNIAAHDFINDTNRATALNAIGGTFSQPVSEGIISKATSPGKALAGLAAGVMMGKLGDATNSVVGQKNRGALSKTGQAMYDGAYEAFSDRKDTHRNDWGDKAVAFGAGLADSFTNPLGMISSAASIYNDRDALMDTAKDFKDVAEFRSYMDGRKNSGYQRSGDDNKETPKGILTEMQKRAGQGIDSSRNQSLINAIPTLTNFWKNVYIK